jgi:hypothetical protein
MIRVRSGGHLPGEDLGDEDEVVAVRARTTEAKPTAEEVAVRAATCSEVARLAGRALVDGVGDERLATAEVSGQEVKIGRWRSRLAQAVGVLLAGVGAVTSAGRDEVGLADGAATVGGRARRRARIPWFRRARWRAVTGTVTHGDVA